MKRQPSRRRNRRQPAPKLTRTPTARIAVSQPDPPQRYEVETILGLEEFARREIRQRLGKRARIAQSQPLAGRIALTFDGDMRRFDALRTAAAVHRVEIFAVPRPRALLGHQHLTRLLTAISAVLIARPDGSFHTFRIAAAGAGSTVFARLRQEIAAATTLQPTDAAAHLHIAVRRALDAQSGWQALIRTAAMPLSARRWRVCDMPGALNANIAAAMVSLAHRGPAERMLNICCGSGALMIERLGMGRAASVTGVDINADALQCADANLRAAGHRASATLLRADCGALPLRTASVNAIAADLPYGMLSGDDISSLYRAALTESARVAAPNASLVLITTRRRALLAALDDARCWRMRESIPLNIPYRSGYIKPQIYRLQRTQQGALALCGGI